jgi:hypothetical protein
MNAFSLKWLLLAAQLSRSFDVCREALHQQEQRTAQMKRLLQKDILIKAASVCYTFGRFTYSQVCTTPLYYSTKGVNHGHLPCSQQKRTMGRMYVCYIHHVQCYIIIGRCTLHSHLFCYAHTSYA